MGSADRRAIRAAGKHLLAIRTPPALGVGLVGGGLAEEPAALVDVRLRDSTLVEGGAGPAVNLNHCTFDNPRSTPHVARGRTA